MRALQRSAAWAMTTSRSRFQQSRSASGSSRSLRPRSVKLRAIPCRCRCSWGIARRGRRGISLDADFAHASSCAALLATAWPPASDATIAASGSDRGIPDSGRRPMRMTTLLVSKAGDASSGKRRECAQTAPAPASGQEPRPKTAEKQSASRRTCRMRVASVGCMQARTHALGMRTGPRSWRA